jgi:hypothetical protein
VHRQSVSERSAAAASASAARWLPHAQEIPPSTLGSHVAEQELQGWVAAAGTRCAHFAFNNDAASAGLYQLADTFHGHGKQRTRKNKGHR